MKLLLDTHVALWAVLEPERLPVEWRRWIVDPNNDVAVSVVVLWELAIKRSVSRRIDPALLLTPLDAEAALREADIAVLPIAARHLQHIEALPFHHRDPFDRLLVATALADGLTLLTMDATLGAYGKAILVA